MVLYTYSDADWMYKVNIFRLVLYYAGVAANLFLTMTATHCNFSYIIPKVLVITQSSIDSLVCFISAMYIHFQEFQNFESPPKSLVMCHLWVSNWPLFFLLACGLLNLLSLTFDRFWSVVCPTNYKSRTRLRISLTYISIIIAAFLLSLPIMLQVSFDQGKCFIVPGPSLLINSYVWVVGTFFLPTLLHGLFYLWILSVLRGDAEFYKLAKNRFTTTVLTTVISHTLLIVPDAFYFLIGHSIGVDYLPGTPIQTFTATCLTVNSCLSPITYLVLMKKLRQTALRMLAIICGKTKSMGNVAETEYSNTHSHM
ncbi:hypothetical protein CRM22_006175 [Opisthorchis felineus]|uniref:G-protein coupled receptors family 1 profile domain-containing protein n=1 Tax=Opisthorchis felineus TaxID=147828 RepID=A0A4S2LMK9_OPIFE|nr:hypothetical protein CRM22_006175 [Opisthorchis felineus]